MKELTSRLRALYPSIGLHESLGFLYSTAFRDQVITMDQFHEAEQHYENFWKSPRG